METDVDVDVKRQVFFALAASPGFQVRKRDVKSAFLQGNASEIQREVLVEPMAELSRSMGLRPWEVVRLRKAW
jgi:hypothetical protein